jgi:hypothetical protein
MAKQVTLENTLAGGFGLPTGQVVPGTGSIVLEPEVWDAAKDHPVVKARIDAGTLIVDGKGKKRESADDRDENGDTPEMAQLRTMFDASYKRQGDALAAAQTDVSTLTGKVADLEAAVESKDREIATLKAGNGGQNGSGDGGGGVTTYTVKEQSAGWFAVVDAEGKAVTKNLRKTDLAEFDVMNDADKAAFIDLNKADEK